MTTAISPVDQAITELPDPPTRLDSIDKDIFNEKSNAFIPTLKTLSTQLETFRGQLNTTVSELNQMGIDVQPVLDNLVAVQNAADNAIAAQQAAGEAIASAASVDATKINHIVGSGLANETYDANQTDNLLKKKFNPAAMSGMLYGALAFANYTIKKNFAIVTWTGDGGTQLIASGIDSVDFTVSGNGSGYWLDRSVNKVKDDAGNVVASGSAIINTSKVHIKSRSTAGNHGVFDGLRGIEKRLQIDTQSTEVTTSNEFVSFDTNGFTVGNAAGAYNLSGVTYVGYQTLFTHVKWGVTEQDKLFVEAYNPVTKQGMIYHLGSAGNDHKLPHSQGVVLDLWTHKSLTAATTNWQTFGTGFGRLILNDTNADFNDSGTYTSVSDDTGITISNSAATSNEWNALNGEYVIYYKAKSTTWTIGTFLSTGEVPQHIECIDSNGNTFRPARVITKDLVTAGNYSIGDNKRANDGYQLLLNLNTAEDSVDYKDMTSTGFNVVTSNYYAGDTVLFIAEADTNANGGDSFFDFPTVNSNLQLTNASLNYCTGKDGNGYVLSSEQIVSETIDFSGVSDGFKYVAKKQSDGTYQFFDEEPMFGSYEKQSPDDNRLIFQDGKWYETTGGELVDNGTFDVDTSGWTSVNDAILSVVNGALKVQGNVTDYPAAAKTIPVEIGKKYRIKVSNVLNDTTLYYSVSDGDGNVVIQKGYTATTATSDIDQIVTANTTSFVFNLGAGSVQDTAVSQYDNISVFAVEPVLSTEIGALSFIGKFMCQSETPQYQDFNWTPFQSVMDSLLVNDKLEAASAKFTKGFDLGQGWHDETGKKALYIEYENDKKMPINVMVSVITANNTQRLFVDIYHKDGSTLLGHAISGTATAGAGQIGKIEIPVDASFKIYPLGGTASVEKWAENYTEV